MANEREPNNTRSSADLLTANQYTYGNLARTSDDDFYKLTVYAAGKIEIDFLSPSSGESFFPDYWNIRVYDSLGNTLNLKPQATSGSFNTYVDKPGTYYLRVYQQDSFDLDGRDYGIKYSFESGNYSVGFENNNSSSNASPMTIGKAIYGNLYNEYDRDYYSFNLPSYHDTIKVTYDLPPTSGSSFFPETFTINLYDAATGTLLDGGEFSYDGSFTVSTKATGKFYILVKEEYYGDLNRELYKLTVETSDFNTSSGSSEDISGTSGNDTRTLTSRNDSWQVGLGIDKINGGTGEDTIIVPDDYVVTSAIDVKGSSAFTGIEGKPFLYIKKSGDDYTVATNFEKITYEGSTYSISSFIDTVRYDLSTITIPNKSVSNNSTSNISLSDYFYSLNANTSSITYSIQSISNNNLKDQITLSGSTLKLKAGSQGSSQSVEVTIRATQNFSDDWTFNTDSLNYEDQTFTVSMSDLYDSVTIKDSIFDQDLSYKSSSLKINLDDYFTQTNSGYSIQYSITSSSSQSYASINGSVLTIFTRQGVYETVPIEISARNLDSNGNTISGDTPTLQTFNITFAPDIIGSDGDDTITGSSGNDVFNLTDGHDLLDGGSGTDILVIPANPWIVNVWAPTLFIDYVGKRDYESFVVVKGIDIDGSITGEVNKEFLNILKLFDSNSPSMAYLDENLFTEDGDKYINVTYAFNFEKIYYENKLYDYDDFIANGYYKIGNKPKLVQMNFFTDDDWYAENVIKIPDQKIANSSSKTINLENYFINANADLDLKFELVSVKDDISPKNDKLSDQITLSGSNLKITSGSSGDLITAKVTITGKLKFDPNGIRTYSEEYFNYSSVGGSDNLIAGINDGNENPDTSGLEIAYTRTFEVTMTDDDYTEDISDDYTEDISSSENNNSYKLSSIKNENGPNLSAFSSTSKTSGTLNHSANNEIIVLTGQAGSIRGLDGDDTYFISDLLPKNSKTSIIDTGGDNIIQIPDNTLITKIIFTSNATRLTLGNDQEITINGADRFIFNVSGNSLEGDKGESLTFSEFAKLFGVELSSKTQTVNEDFYTKSESGSSSSSFNIINVSGNEDTVIFGTNEADEFRFEINDDGTSAEGPYDFTIEGFDKSIDKLTLVNKTGNNILTTQQFDSLKNVEVISDGLSGTQIYFAPDNNARSGKLTLEGISETFSDNWTVNSYEVSIAPTSYLSSLSDETTYKFSSTPDSSQPILIEFNSSLSSGTLNFSDQNDLIILTGSGKSARGLSGDDTYFISSLIPENSKITVVDTDGQNTIQIPDNTYISKSLFTKNAARITLENGREVTINKADTFVYNLGGNITTGDKGVDLNYTEFASAFGVDDVLSLTSSSNGTIADQYII